jgi:hypothetical protein
MDLICGLWVMALLDYLAEEAAAAVRANQNRPFFLYLAFNAPHTPLQALR